MNTRSSMLVATALLCASMAHASDPDGDATEELQPIGLVFTLDGEIPSGQETTYALDIDGDGTLESIVPPAFGGALLAIDPDGDGDISVGAELFGVSTGAPFAELAAYDSNGDGLIDAGDESYYSLFAWTPKSSEPGSTMELRSLEDVGIEALTVVSEFLDDGGEANCYMGADGSVGFMATVDVSTFAEVPALAGCKKGDPKGTCEDEEVGLGGQAWKCKNPTNDCTNNQGGAGKCETNPGIQNHSFCNCTGSERSPILDGHWTTLLGALLACVTGFAALRSRG